MLQNLSCRALAFGLAVMGLPGLTAAASSPSTGLGQAWPHATDVSLSPHYHVYVFVRDGIRYIQINDTNGVVHGAVAAARDVVLVLPIGVDAAHVKTLRVAQASPTVTPASQPNTETVYHDQALTITVTPQTTGTSQITTLQAATCTDPGECSNNVISSH